MARFDGDAVDAVFLDVEGTTTPLTFVYDVLFPYVRARIPDYLRRHWDDPEVRSDVALLRREHRTDRSQGVAVPEWREGRDAELDAAVAYALFLMDGDRKATGLKGLQGRIWQEGYEQGVLHGQVYPDVPPAFARWVGQGRAVAIFSSGSVLAQKLLFATTAAGDLTRYIRAHFDTTTGSKREAGTYGLIAHALGVAPGRALFLSDTVAELECARGAGLFAALCVRDGDPPAASPYPVVRTFDAVCPAP